jgi:L-Ala-D/L-Glu epimerase
MKISEIEVYKSPIKLKKPFVTSLGPQDFADNIIVVIRTDNGITGYGECNPFMSITGDSMDTGFLVGQKLGKSLLEKNPLDIEKCSVLMDSIIYGNTSIKSAFDIALHDIAAQDAGLPLYRFLSGSNNKEMVTDYTVSLGDPEEMASDALEIKNKGFQIIKIKLGGSQEQDILRIRLIRESVGSSIPIRVDANQGWKASEAIRILTALAPFGIQFCEEPIPRWDFMELPRIRASSPIPIMSDESCFDHHDAMRLVSLSACDMFNIKLGKSSGITKARKIIKIGEEAGMKMQVGGFLESRLAFTASAHMSLTSNNIVYFDFDTPLMFVEDPVVGGITYDKKGSVFVPEQPGLGATVDDRYLESLEKVVLKK